MDFACRKLIWSISKRSASTNSCPLGGNVAPVKSRSPSQIKKLRNSRRRLPHHKNLTPSLTASANYFGYGLVAAFLLCLVVSSLVVWRLHRTATTPLEAETRPSITNAVILPTPVVTLSVSPAPTVVEKNISTSLDITTPPPNPFDAVHIQGIFYRATNPLAIINGKTAGIGDRLNDLQVVGIDQHSVTPQLHGERKFFRIN